MRHGRFDQFRKADARDTFIDATNPMMFILVSKGRTMEKHFGTQFTTLELF